jgi:hypothetical protein
MQITRRHLLALGTATAAAGLIGVGATAVHWWDQPPHAGFKQLSAQEAAIVRAWAAAAFPGGEAVALDGGQAGLDHFFDGVLTHTPAIQRKLLKVLLHAVNNGTLAMCGARLTTLPGPDARAVFHQLSAHEVAEVRGAMSGLTVLLGMGYSTHPEVAPIMARWHRCGYG